MAIEHFLAVASVLIVLSCPSQYYCDGGKLHIVNDFWPVVLPTFSRKPFPDRSLEPNFICALQVKAGHLPVTSMSVSIVKIQNHSVKGSWYRRKSTVLRFWVLILTLPLSFVCVGYLLKSYEHSFP